MSKVVVGAVLVAVSLAGFTIWRLSWPGTTGAAADDTAGTESKLDGLVARLDDLARRLESIENAQELLSVASADAGAGPRLRGAESASSAAPQALAEGLEAVGNRVAALEEAQKSGAARYSRSPSGKWPTSTVAAQSDLGLTDVQRAEWDRILVNGRRDMDALRAVPDEDGKTWEQIQGGSASGTGPARFDSPRVMEFRAKTIPGRTETFGQAAKRIREDLKRRLRETLTSEQLAKYDLTSMDPLITEQTWGP